MCALVAWSPRVAADAGRVHLSTHAAEHACIREDALRAGVERMLGRGVFTDDRGAARAQAHVTFARDGEGWSARFVVARGEERLGDRELHTPERSCHALDGALMLVIALALDVEQVRSVLTLPPEPEPEPAAPEVVVPPPPEERAPGAESVPVPEVRAPRAREWRAMQGIGARVAWGRLPGALFDLFASFTLGIGDHLELAGVAALAPPMDAGEGRARMRRWVAGGEMWGRLVLPRHRVFAVRPQLGVGVARFEAEPLQISRPTTERGTLLELLLGADVLLPAPSPLFAVLRLELGIPLLAHTFFVDVDGLEQGIFEAPPVFFRTSLELGLSTAQ